MRKYQIIDAATLRRAIEDAHSFLADIGLDETCLFYSKLVFNELASNAVKHTQAGGEVGIIILEERVEITLLGDEPFRMPKASVCADVYAEGGRGLFLIDSVCAQREELEKGVKIVLERKK